MESTEHHEKSRENSNYLLSAGVGRNVREFDVSELVPLSRTRDRCDAFPDAIDTQLSPINYRHMHGGKMSYDFPFSVKAKGGEPKLPSEPILRVGGSVMDVWSQRKEASEQCQWRLEKLLRNSTEKPGTTRKEDKPLECLCSGDFSTCFKGEDLSVTQRSLQCERLTNDQENPSKTQIKHLAGIPVQNFDSVTIDSDLDTVYSEQVRQHVTSARCHQTRPVFNPCRSSTAIRNNDCSSSSQGTEDQSEEDDDDGDEVITKLDFRRSKQRHRRKGKKKGVHLSRRKKLHSITGKTGTDANLLAKLMLSLSTLQQQKTATADSLEKLKEELVQMKREQQRERAQAEDIRCELIKLKVQRSVYLEEVRDLQEQQGTRQKATPTHECSEHCLSSLEREEMGRLLKSAQSELFAEQRRSRQTLERLEEMTQELEKQQEEHKNLKMKYDEMEKHQAAAARDEERMKKASHEALKQQVKRCGELEKSLALKAQLVQKMEDEKKSLRLQLCSLRDEQSVKLVEIHEAMKTEKEQEMEQMTFQLSRNHKEELQKVCLQADVMRSTALNEQAQVHKHSLDSCIQMKNSEIKRLREALKHNEEKMSKRTKEMREEKQDEILKAVRREQRKCDEQREKELKEQHALLEELLDQAVMGQKKEVEKERRNTLELQSKLNQLQRESEMELESLKESLQTSVKELEELRNVLGEKEQKHKRRIARHEQQARHLARDVHAECVRMREMLAHNGLTAEIMSSDSSTAQEVLQDLQKLTKALRRLVGDLKNELDSQRQDALQLSEEKEQALRLQKTQLTEEKEQALSALKQTLNQERVKEVSSRLRSSTGADEQLDRLRRQLQAKNQELRLVQNNMVQWKEQTTAKLTRKYELELTAELERRRSRAGVQRNPGRQENQTRPLPGNSLDLPSYRLLRHQQESHRRSKRDAEVSTRSHLDTEHRAIVTHLVYGP